MKVLITGGVGFVGSHVVDELRTAGHEMVIVDNLLSSKKEYAPEGIPLYEIDMASKELGEVFEKEKPDAVCHLAAKTNLRESIEDPFSDIHGNIVGLVNVCEEAVKHGVKQFVFSSTGGALYGNTDMLPVPETAPTNPISPYGVSKLAGEKYLYYYNQVHGLPVTILRYSNIYGPRNERKEHKGAVTLFIQKALNGEEITIFGDGEQTRDFVYVKDIARANRMALERSGKDYLVVNTSGGSETSLSTFMEYLKEILGPDVRITHGEAKKGEVRRSYLDVSKIKETLGWEPEYGVKQGLRETVEYLEKSEGK